MSWKHVERPGGQPRVSIAEALAAGLVAFALGVVAFQAFMRVSVTVDGRRVRVPVGITVAELVARDEGVARAGDLLALDRTVLREGGGEAPSVWIDGSRAASDTPVAGGAQIVTREGADVVERIVRATHTIPIPVQITGSGPIVQLASTGAPGAVIVRAGAVSGQVVATETVLPPTPMTVVRTRGSSAGGQKLVALTFDDGPWPGSTESILRVLREYDVRATFFMVGSRIARQPGAVRKVVADGHEVANHTLSHRDLRGASEKIVRGQVRRGAERIEAYAGAKPHWFRPPGGGLTSVVLEETRRANESVVLWSVDPQDWGRPGWKTIAARVVNVTRPGDVILLHDGGGDRTQTLQALPRIIRQLRARGFTFVTLDQMAEAGTKPVSRLGGR